MKNLGARWTCSTQKAAGLIAVCAGAFLILAAAVWPLHRQPVPRLQSAQTIAGPKITVFASPSCECCKRWINHLIEHGLDARVRHTDALPALKDSLGVPASMRSCHTATADGYFIEGHVPAADIQRMLSTKPQIKGLAVPGMPEGSPGMESRFESAEPFTVNAINRQGRVVPYARHPSSKGVR